MLSPHSRLISCTSPLLLPSFPRRHPKPLTLVRRTIQSPQRLPHPARCILGRRGSRGLVLVCRGSVDGQAPGSPVPEVKEVSEERSRGGSGGSGNDWTTSVLLFGLWAALMYYVFKLTPDQTPASFAAGLGLIVYAGLASGDEWKEFFQYFRESKFIHIMSLDFSLFTAFSPFWVYNDMTARKWIDKGSWLLPAALVPFVGPALYLLLRPPLSALPVSVSTATIEED